MTNVASASANTQQAPLRKPLAFVDKTGFVTPFNGRIDRTLSGWYIYDQAQLDAALDQQRRLEQARVGSSKEVVVVDYSISAVEAEAASGGQAGAQSENPEWATQLLGVKESIPFLNIQPDVVVKPATVVSGPGDLHQDVSGVNLTPEQTTALQETERDPQSMLRHVMG